MVEGRSSGRRRIVYTQEEEEARKTFILQRLRSGFSRLEVLKQFANEFDCHMETARRWYNQTCDELAPRDIKEKRRLHAAIVEMYHAQITASQADLVAVQTEISSAEQYYLQRNQLVEQALQHIDQPTQVEEIEKKLSLLPPVRPETKSGLIEVKSKIRERMFKVMSELTRLQGVGSIESDWEKALHTLLNNGLIPPRVAEVLLATIEDINTGVESIANRSNWEEVSEETNQNHDEEMREEMGDTVEPFEFW